MRRREQKRHACLWQTTAPTALAIRPQREHDAHTPKIEATLAGSGLRATSANQREQSIEALTSEGLSHPGEISTLLLIAATLALAAALTSAIWQRRVALPTPRTCAT